MSYFIITSSGNHVSPLEGIQIYRHVILSTFTGLYGVILFSLFIEPVVSEEKHWLRFSLQFVNMSFFGSSTIVGFYFFIWDQCIAAGLYILCACACRVLGWAKRAKGTPTCWAMKTSVRSLSFTVHQGLALANLTLISGWYVYENPTHRVGNTTLRFKWKDGIPFLKDTAAWTGIAIPSACSQPLFNENIGTGNAGGMILYNAISLKSFRNWVQGQEWFIHDFREEGKAMGL